MQNKKTICEQINDLLQRFLYRELDQKDDKLFKEHISSCSSCYDKVKADLQIHATLESFFKEYKIQDIPDFGWKTFYRKALSEQTSSKTLRFGWIWQFTTAMAACAVFVLSVFMVFNLQKQGKNITKQTDTLKTSRYSLQNKDLSVDKPSLDDSTKNREKGEISNGRLARLISNPQIEKHKKIKKLKRFNSCKDLYEKLKEIPPKNIHEYYLDSLGTIEKEPNAFAYTFASTKKLTKMQNITPVVKSVKQFSTTNVQVEGVDEADIVKTDGNFIYAVSDDRVAIVRAYPVEQAKLESIIPFAESERPLEIYIEKDKLLTLSRKSHYIDYYKSDLSKPASYAYPNYYNINTLAVRIYDTTDKSKPKLLRKLEFEGFYTSSRKIGSYVYLVLTYTPRYYYEYNKSAKNSVYKLVKESAIPKIIDSELGANTGKDTNTTVGSTQVLCPCSNIRYIDPVKTSNFLILASVSLENPKFHLRKQLVLGASDTIYASLNNVYVANNFNEYNQDNKNQYSYENKTHIYKFAVKNGYINFKGTGEVVGRPINQFAMDEYNNNFRIATQSFNSNGQASNVYILDSNLNIIGKIENLAKTENMHSARFMNNRLYLVTFKKIDPLFVIDLTDPENPKVLGELKIPGYSDYLHPFDENHLIGIGKDTQDMGNFAWYQGLKVALFDVSDPKNPQEKFVEIIGDRGTDTPVLSDHKAFLFDKEKNLLVLPITLAEIPNKQKEQQTGNTYGQYTFSGAYVYNLTLKDGFKLKGKVSHYEEGDFPKNTYYGYNSSFSIKRALYIENILYTISGKKVGANKLDNLDKITEVGY